MALRTGVVIPYGNATGDPGDSLGRRYAWEIPLALDIGAKVSRSVFVGMYLGAAFGSTGSDERLDAACTDDDDNFKNDIVCTAVTSRIGLEAQYSFQPEQRINPWIGYGIGYELASASISDDYSGYSETVTSTGVTYADLAVGFDARWAVGFGPFLDVAIGQFHNTTTRIKSEPESRVHIQQPALHAWIMLGVRMVINP